MEGIAFGKMIFYKDEKYNFVEFFNEENGFYLRSNVICDNTETEIEATMRSFPELLDIGIMGTCMACESGICKMAGIDCYQNASLNKRTNMSVEAYRRIIKQCKNKVFQVALGGSGDPNKHESFEEILQLTRENNIVPNLTTSGFQITQNEVDLIKKYCGAVAVSYYSNLKDNKETNPITINAIKTLVSAGCKTNIHYVISKKNIEEAIYRVKHDLFPESINAIVFLLYKPVGLGQKEFVLTANDSLYIEFIKLVTSRQYRYKIGFDSCQTPALNIYADDVSSQSLEWCESSRFSMYIDCNCVAYPCSFGQGHSEYSFDLNNETIEDAWNSKQFNLFRERQSAICSGCNQAACYNCALNLDLNDCGKAKE